MSATEKSEPLGPRRPPVPAAHEGYKWETTSLGTTSLGNLHNGHQARISKAFFRQTGSRRVERWQPIDVNLSDAYLSEISAGVKQIAHS